jgi:hypothetical protein
VSAGPVSDRRLSKRAMRLLVITLTFLCVGPAVQTALEAAVIVCYLVYVGDVIHWIVDTAPRFVWRMPAFTAVPATLTGLIAGICEMSFGRINARGMLAISFVIPLVGTLLWISPFPWTAILPFFRSLFVDPNAFRVFVWLLTLLLSFVAAMMACWKIAVMVRGKTPAVDVAQLFD